MPQWTDHAREVAVRYILQTGVIAAPPQLYAALFQTSAQPGAGAECVDASYARHPIGGWSQDTTDVGLFGNTSEVDIAFAADNFFDGVALYDAVAGGTCWAWHDYDLTYSVYGGTSVPIPVKALLMGLDNPS